MLVHEVMTANVKSCKHSQNLELVARLMWDNDCGAIPVVDDANHPVGIITDRDIAMAAMLNHRPLWDMSVGDIIRDQKMVFCRVDEPVQSCIASMEKHCVRRIPIVDAGGSLAGILSLGDAIAFTQDGKSRTAAIPVEDTLAMLKTVSAHHNSSGTLSGGRLSRD